MSRLADARTARRLTAAAKTVTGTDWTTQTVAPGIYRMTLRTGATIHDELTRLRHRHVRNEAIRLGFDATWGPVGPMGKNGYAVTVIDTDSREREAARYLGYASVEDYRNAPGRNLPEVTAETTVEQWGPDAVAVTREYDTPAAELTGELRTDDTGVTRYWTAAELAAEAAQKRHADEHAKWLNRVAIRQASREADYQKAAQRQLAAALSRPATRCTTCFLSDCTCPDGPTGLHPATNTQLWV